MRKGLARFRRAITAALAIVLAVGTLYCVAPKEALADPTTDARHSVVYIEGGMLEGENWFSFGSGSAFFVGNTGENPQYLITNFHVVQLYKRWGSGQLADFPTPDGKTHQGRAMIRLFYDDKNYVEAYIVDSDEIKDLALLKVEKPSDVRAPLVVKVPEESMVGSGISVIGYPGIADNSFAGSITSKGETDSSITKGTVSRLFTQSGTGVKQIQTDANIMVGNSGGPMVDENGNVIGVNTWGIANGGEQLNYAINIEEACTLLDRNIVTYQKDGGAAPSGNQGNQSNQSNQEATSTTPATSGGKTYNLNTTKLSSLISTAEGYEEDDYTEDSYNALVEATNSAKSVRDETSLDDSTSETEYNTKQQTIDDEYTKLQEAIDGLEEKADEGLPLAAIIGIVAGVVAVIGIIVAVVLVRKNKKKKEAQAAPPVNDIPWDANNNMPHVVDQSQQFVQPVMPEPPVAPAAPIGEPATTVLDEGAEGTTLLSEQVNGGMLTRMSTNEQIVITRAEIKLGRESRRVDYCLTGNGNIGRLHARIIVRDEKVYIVDCDSTNGTFVNNVKLRPGQEQLLHDNDIIKLADEKFRYTS